MDQQFDLCGEECTIPSQAHFGHRQILLHTSWGFPFGQRQQFRSIKFNAQYRSKKWLCEKISQETCLLSEEMKKGQFTSQQCLIYYLKRILKHIIKHADEQGMYLEHKILYLTFKFLLHLICKRAITKKNQIDQQVSLHQWLIDVDALFFKSNSQISSLQGENLEDELIQCLKWKDYEGMLTHLQIQGAKESEEANKRKIEHLIKILIMKIENQESEFTFANKTQEMKTATKITLQSFQREANEVFKQEKGKKKNSKVERKDKLQFISEVLLGNYEKIQTLVKDSWPLFLTHVLDMQSVEPLKSQDLKQQVKSFLNLKNKNSIVILSKETEYFLNLLSGKSLHIIYQSLFDLVNPFFAHLIAYFFYYFYQAAPLLVIMQEDYMNDLIRNMLQQSSQVSYKCLFLVFGVIQSNDMIEKKGQMFEPLLYYHLSVVDIDDFAEIDDFLKKIKFLSIFALEKYGQSHFQRLFFKLLDNNKLNQAVVESYVLISSLYGKSYNYEFDMIAFIDKYFTQNGLPQETYQKIMNINSNLQGKKKNRRFLRELEKILPSFEKFRLLEEAKNEQEIDKKIKTSIQLIKLTMQSLPLNNLIYEIITSSQQINSNGLAIELSQDQINLRHQLLINIRRYLDHYPKVHSYEEGKLLQAIDLMIS